MSEITQGSTPIASPTPFRARNMTLAAASALVAAATAGFFAIRFRTVPGMLCLPIAIYALYSAIASFRGVQIDSARISAPKAAFRPIPIFPFGRFSTPTSELRDITSLGEFWGFQVVGLTVQANQIPILFANRDQKLAFFAALKAIDPDTKIYRTF